MGITLLGVSAGDITNYAEGVPAGRDIAYALGTLGIIVLVQRFFRGFLGTIAVLLGLVIGTAVALILGDTSFGGVTEASAFGVTTPFYFGVPTFSLTAIISMIIVMLITMVETTGDVFAAGEIVGRRIRPEHRRGGPRRRPLHAAGRRAELLPVHLLRAEHRPGAPDPCEVPAGWCAGAGDDHDRARRAAQAGRGEAIPLTPTLGGASLALVASVALVGIHTLSKVDLTDNRTRSIVGTSLGLAMLVSFKPDIAGVFPSVGAGVRLLGRDRRRDLRDRAEHPVLPHRPSARCDGHHHGLRRAHRDLRGGRDGARDLRVPPSAPSSTAPPGPSTPPGSRAPSPTPLARRAAIEDAVLTADRSQQDALVEKLSGHGHAPRRPPRSRPE